MMVSSGFEEEKPKSTYLAATKNFITWEVEHVNDQLRNSIPSDPEEDSLAILNQEETVSLQPFGSEWQWWGHDHTMLANSSGL